jgi:hypothetical protein
LCIDGKEWRDREGGLIIMKLVCENKKDFLLDKKNYCKKVIEALVYGYKNCSEIIQKHSAEILTNFLKNLPNFSEITLLLEPGILSKIYEMQCQSTTEINTKLDDVIQLTDSLNDIGCNYDLCQYKVSNVANNITNISQSLMSNIKQRCNEDNI